MCFDRSLPFDNFNEFLTPSFRHQDSPSRILGVRRLSLWMVFLIGTLPGGLSRSADTSLEHSSSTVFRVGVAAIEVTPTTQPSIIAGGFLESRSNEVRDRLFVRSFALDDGNTKIVLSVVDTCMMTQALIDEAKQIAHQACRVPIERMMVSATHTHSAPAAMACLGTRQDKAYAAWLPAKIAESIIAAHRNLQPAKIGWAIVNDWEHTHNRRWIRKPESKVVDPFGNATGLAHMHPGYLSPDVIGPSGPVDPALSVLSFRTVDDKPLGVLANYSQHYFGSGPVSADYYGLFCKYMAQQLDQPGEGNGPFVCAMSQGTSGDQMWMDYGSPAESPSMAQYAEAVASYADRALAQIEYKSHAPISMVEKTIDLKYRVPDAARLEWARPIAEKIDNDLAKSIPEVYAMEALILHQRQRTSIKLQSIVIGDLSIATLPNEVYALTGLKLRGRSPLPSHFNIELANGAEGYIPTPEQHVLGGYTTWPARTAGLEVDAEPKIVENLVAGLEEASKRPRRKMEDAHGPYAQRILEATPLGYWRLNDEDGSSPRNSVPGGDPASLHPGFALYLPGVGSGTGIGTGEALTASRFSGESQINRSIHFAGGYLETPAPRTDSDRSIAFWFWLGEKSGVSDRRGQLVLDARDTPLIAHQDSQHHVRFEMAGERTSQHWAAEDWHMAVLIRAKSRWQLHVDGSKEPALQGTYDETSLSEDRILFGQGLQGKLDEVAIFSRVLASEEVQRLWEESGIAEQRREEARQRQLQEEQAIARSKPPAFPESYAATILAMKPRIYDSLEENTPKLKITGNVQLRQKLFATLRHGRLEANLDPIPQDYSVSFWFRNEIDVSSRPVTAYLFSRGPDGNSKAPGDHLGIGGTYRGDLTGKLIVFNGNDRDQVVVGRTVVPTQQWHHVVMIRQAERVRVFLNGDSQPEIDARLDSTADNSSHFFWGARSDQFAPLQGNLANIAFFDRILNEAEASTLHAASGQPVGTHSLPMEQHVELDSQPISPEESLNRIHVPKGFRVDLMAAEPLTVDPVAMDWDAQGRLWVVEMSDYPLGMDGQGKSGGRVRVLSDQDGDGVYDSSRFFVDGLNFPNGIITWRDGVLVTAAPQILFLRDTDRDGDLDEREVLFDGFHEGNQQLRLNGLRWGLDGWIHCANGGHHAGHGVGTKVTSARNGKVYEVGSRDFRIDPDTGELEVESGPSQFGRNRDAWGHWFGTQNANPLWHYVIEDRYLGRNPYVATTPPIQHVVGPNSPEVFPASRLEKRFHSFEQSGRFTSACGSLLYGDRVLFRDQGRLHAFVCEPFHNLVQHNLLENSGSSFVAHRAEPTEPFDFFASEDRWCRPVMARTGPDGGLWIADMYRYMIEHPDWLPPEGKAELLPHYRYGDDKGRIYRVLPNDHVANIDWNWDASDAEELVAKLETTNDWVRDKVHQILLWRNDQDAVPALRALMRMSRLPEVRVQSMAILKNLHQLSVADLVSMLKDQDASVRECAIRFAEGNPDRELLVNLVNLVDDPDAKVSLQLCLVLGGINDGLAGHAIVRIASRYPDDRFLEIAIIQSMGIHAKAFVDGFADPANRLPAKYQIPLVKLLLGTGQQEHLHDLLSRLVNDEKCTDEKLAQMLRAMHELGFNWELMGSEANAEVRSVVQRLQQRMQEANRRLLDSQVDLKSRLGSGQLLSQSSEHRDRSMTMLAEWLTPQRALEEQYAVLRVLGQSGADCIPNCLIQHWPTFTPELRGAALDIWMSRLSWTEDLLGRIERNELAASTIDLVRRTSLMQNPVEAIAHRAKKLFEETAPSSRSAVVERYAPALTLKGDPAKGRDVFKRVCANCHRYGEEGHEVGPNLATVIQHSPEKILKNILDPNVDIQPGFLAFTCVLDDDEVLTGVLAGETASSLAIKQANGVVRDVARNEIRQLKSAGVSFMPEGLEANLNHQEMADLIRFLRQSNADDE